MFDLLSRWRVRTEPTAQDESIPWPATAKSKRSGKQFTLEISPPLARGSPGSLTGFEPEGMGNWPYSQSSSGRASPLRSQAAWLNSSDVLSEEPTTMQSGAPPPQVVRMDSVSQPQPSSHAFPITRSVSSPPATPSYQSPHSLAPPGPSPGETPTSKWGLRLHTNANFSQSTQSLHLEGRPHSYDMDVFGNACSYPLAKQLSPIAEQDYFSPDSVRNSKGIPSMYDKDLSRSGSLARSQHTSPSPAGSQTSDITRPSPIYASPFITRQLNRTTSQTSSHLSGTSSIPHLSAKSKSSDGPSIALIDLKPSFLGQTGLSGPGPHPRPPKRPTVATMPTIIASSDGHMDEVCAGDDDHISLHAESFVSASSGNTNQPLSTSVPLQQRGRLYDPEIASMRSGNSRLPSASESFIARRGDREAGFPEEHTFRAKRQLINATPAFWTFWLGFICPLLWLIGGWHFTNFGEQPPRLNFWEFYFNAGYWKEKLCLGRGKNARENRMSKMPPLPKWVAEKQLSDDGRARLNDPKRSLRGISFGYPFIPRSVRMPTRDTRFSRTVNHLLVILEKPNRLFDHLYGVKLREVRGRPESPRRMFDPWIQRCRYALCYAVFLLSIGLFTSSIYLIVSNTRQLH